MSVAAPGLANDLDVLAFALRAMQSDQKAALATIIGVEGPFSRPVGAQLAILEGGAFVGSISGGCLETALCEEARDALVQGKNKTLRYGQGSPFIDVRLPCGGGVDIFVDADLNQATLGEALQAGNARREFHLSINTCADQKAMSFRSGSAQAPDDGVFTRLFRPTVRLVLAGRGWEIVALSQLANEAGYEVCVLSQEAATLEYCRPFSHELISLSVPERAPAFALDAASAFVCLFHEHEWEAPLLVSALASPAFYIGALGSKKTSAERMELLRARGVTNEAMDRLHGPIGLFHAQSPRALAVSTLAQIMSELPN